MPHSPSPFVDVARLTRLTQYFATEAVRAGDVAAFPPPAALAGLPAIEKRRLLDGLLTIRPPRPIRDDDAREDLDALLAAEAAERVRAAGATIRSEPCGRGYREVRLGSPARRLNAPEHSATPLSLCYAPSPSGVREKGA